MLQKLFLKSIGAGLNLVSFFFPKLAVEWAMKFFGTPQKTPIREKEMAFLGTARQVKRTVGSETPIVEYHWGDEKLPLVLLSYGWEYNVGRWRYFVPALVESGFRVIAYDPPGHGLAPGGMMHIPRNAMIIKGLIEKYGRPEVILGHSFGGSSSVFALSQLPERMHPERMVIMASFSYAPRIFRDFAKALGMCEALYFGVVRAFEKRVGHRIDDFDFARMCSRFPHISGLLVHSSDDPVTPFREAKRYFDFWDGAGLFDPKTGGHHLGKPEITAAILDFSINGNLPQGVDIQEFAFPGEHDLARHFSGM